MTRCTISSNNATAGTGLGGPGGGSGGGIYNVAEMNVSACTVANNTASGSSIDFGGGFANFGPLSIRDSTIAGNQADFGGGLSGNADLGNTILALNIASSGPDCSGSIISSDYNLIQNTSGMSISGTTTHNITGQNPLLTPLQDNQGGTFGFGSYGFTMLTRMPLPGSPALDKGNATSRDQRGFRRPYDSPLIGNAAGGNGSEIGAWEIWPPLELDIRRTGTNIVVSWFTNGTAVALELVTNLVEGNNWVFQGAQPVRIGDRSYVTNSLLNRSTFYRLAPD